MISGKSYVNWIKEAGRGHLAAILSWGSYGILLGVMTVRLQLDLLYTFFGMGSNLMLLSVCSGLGLALGLLEFSYLLQAQKQDFYFSLPVKKRTIFYGRYLHGLLHGLLPMVCYMLICGIYQSSLDELFLKVSVSYTCFSILVYGIIFLLFYHISIFAVCVCGHWISALCILGMILYWFQIFLRNGCLIFMEQFYKTFYKSPLLEMLERLLIPWQLAGSLSGQQMSEKFELLEYRPDLAVLLAGGVWIIVLALLTMAAERRRKAENVGKVFALPQAERGAEVAVSILAGIAVCGFLLTVSAWEGWNRNATWVLLVAAGVVAVLAVHGVLERLLQNPFQSIGRRKGQMALETVLVALFICVMLGNSGRYDRELPKDEEVGRLKIALSGLDMDQDTYRSMSHDATDYVTDVRMKEYTLSEEGKESGMRWVRLVQEQMVQEQMEQKAASKYAKVTVCFEKQNGKNMYRTYPVYQENFLAFAEVYDTMEYKQAAYPLITEEAEMAEDAKFVWDDGVFEQTLSLTEVDKKRFLECYREDIEEIKLSDLETAFPIGKIELESQVYRRTTEACIYPFFETCCAFLAEHGVNLTQQIFDYPVQSVKIWESNPTPIGVSGGTVMHRYETEEELAEWKGRLIPQELCVQPLLHPADTTVNAEVEIREPDSGAVISVDCYGIKEKNR